MQIHTLHVEHVVLLIVYTALTIASALLYRGVKGIQWFALYNVSALAGAVCVVLRGNIPDFLSIVVGNLCVVFAYFLLFFSLSTLFGTRRGPLYLQAVLLPVAVVSMLQYGLWHPDTGRRLLAYSLVLGIQQFTIAWIIYTYPGGAPRRVGTPLAVVLLALALMNTVRFIGVIKVGVPADYLQAGPLLAWIVLLNSCLQCGIVVGYVWMTAAILRHELEVLAETDPLTRVLNRRAFEAAAEHHLASFRLSATPLSVVVIDLDRFKPINDSFGHQFGDATLTGVARCLGESLRPGDLLARIGGDEFAILLPATDATLATTLAEHMRACLERLEIFYGSQQASITASFGLAQANAHTRTLDHLILACDVALYTAKSDGGNRCSVLTGSPVRVPGSASLAPEFT